MSAQDFVHEAVVNNPHIAHSEHLLYNLKEIGMSGAWDRTGNNGQTVQSYMDAWDEAVADKNRDPVVTVIKGLNSVSDGSPCMLYIYWGDGTGRIDSIGTITADNNGVATNVYFTQGQLDDNNSYIIFNLESEQYNYTNWRCVVLRGGLMIPVQFDLTNASTDLFRYETSSTEMKAIVEEPITKTGSIFRGGLIKTYVKIQGRVPTNLVGSNQATPTDSDVRISIEDETIIVAPLWYSTSVSELSQVDIASLYAKANHFIELSEGELIPVKGLFENG